MGRFGRKKPKLEMREVEGRDDLAEVSEESLQPYIIDAAKAIVETVEQEAGVSAPRLLAVGAKLFLEAEYQNHAPELRIAGNSAAIHGYFMRHVEINKMNVVLSSNDRELLIEMFRTFPGDSDNSRTVNGSLTHRRLPFDPDPEVREDIANPIAGWPTAMRLMIVSGMVQVLSETMSAMGQPTPSDEISLELFGFGYMAHVCGEILPDESLSDG